MKILISIRNIINFGPHDLNQSDIMQVNAK
jgi:hypothetical protein